MYFVFAKQKANKIFSLFQYGSSTAVNTVLTFAERKTSQEYESSQDTQVALAQLYAHVQSMPESAKKKKLLKQFNRAGGITPSSSTRKGKHTRSRTFGESLKVNIFIYLLFGYVFHLCLSRWNQPMTSNKMLFLHQNFFLYFSYFSMKI